MYYVAGGFDSWARIFKLLRSPETDSKELIPPAYEAWQADSCWYNTTIPTRFLAPIDFLKIPALGSLKV